VAHKVVASNSNITALRDVRVIAPESVVRLDQSTNSIDTLETQVELGGGSSKTDGVLKSISSFKNTTTKYRLFF